ncbi:MAG TPA: Rdx family protein [Polyangiaceae bacterium]|nr:Rdx family protein [Polyangiaceae bacterium]
MPRDPRVEIQYCPRCRWLLRAGWLAQELLTTFEGQLGEVALVPGASGEFDIYLGHELLFSRRARGRFPEAKELKQLIRDRIAPDRSLGHSDRKTEPLAEQSPESKMSDRAPAAEPAAHEAGEPGNEAGDYCPTD